MCHISAIVFSCISKDSRHLIPQLVIFGYFAAIAAMVMVSVSNVFASSRMVSNAEVAPVDTMAPDAPSDTLATGTSIKPQATTEDSIQQETTQQQESTETEQQANAE